MKVNVRNVQARYFARYIANIYSYTSVSYIKEYWQDHVLICICCELITWFSLLSYLSVGLGSSLGNGRQLGLQLGRLLGLQLGRQLGLQLGRQLGLQLGRQLGRPLGREEGYGRRLGPPLGRSLGRGGPQVRGSWNGGIFLGSFSNFSISSILSSSS